MTGWMSRLRRAAALMLGLQILQVAVLAISPVCDVMRAEASATMASPDAHGANPHDAKPHDANLHASHAPSSVTSHAVSHAPHAQSDEAPAPQPAHGEHAECPMAMLCAVTAVAAHAPTVRIVEVTLAEHVPAYAPTAPLSAWRAPETPPPRA